MEKYKEVLGNNIHIKNKLALEVLLDKGRENLLDAKTYNEMLKFVEEHRTKLMTLEFQKEVIKIARDMARMNPNDLYEFIKDRMGKYSIRNVER